VPLIAKRLELLHELIPGAARVAVLINPNNPNFETSARHIATAAQTMSLQISFVKAHGEAEFEPAFETIGRLRAGAAIVSPDGFFASQREQLVALAARYAVPVMYFQREFVGAGGLMSYGTDSAAMFRQAGLYTARLLKGSKPGDLPVLQPIKFVLALNLRTAKTLGLRVPPTLLARADEVIE
jgi:putative ABC transport system substrate-binding protein